MSPAVDVFVIEAVGILPASVAENAGIFQSRLTADAAVLPKEFLVSVHMNRSHRNRVQSCAYMRG